MKTTNYQMLNKLANWFPERNGFINGLEATMIEDTLAIHEMTELELLNLRDFTVMFLSQQEEHLDKFNEIRKINDKISAITAVIDEALRRVVAIA